MIRTITRPSTARCTLPMYISFPLGEPKYGSCSRLGEVMEISHDSANRFLQRERYEGKDLYNESVASQPSAPQMTAQTVKMRMSSS